MRPWPGSHFLWLLLLPALGLAQTGMHVDDPHWPVAYDPHFKKYAKHYFGPNMDWRWFKAQGIAESGLNPKARGPAGAVGVMQILPSTFEEIRKENPSFQKIEDPKWNIAAGIYYDRQLYRRWEPDVSEEIRLHFALASYNAGYAKVYKGFTKARDKHEQVSAWDQVAPFVPRRTRDYLRKLQGLMAEGS